MKLELSRQIFEKKNSDMKFHEIHPVGAELFHADGQTYDEANSRFSQIFRTSLNIMRMSGVLCKVTGRIT